MDIRKWGADAGDIWDLSLNDEPGQRGLVLPGSEIQVLDVGLYLNEIEGHEYWKEHECTQFHLFVRGMEVWVLEFRGRTSVYSDPSYKVAFGAQPEFSVMLSIDEAHELLLKTLPPIEYVRVTPEEWAARRS
jgi:hypothetical protein